MSSLTITENSKFYRNNLRKQLEYCRFSRVTSVKAFSSKTTFFSPNEKNPSEIRHSGIPHVLSAEERYKNTKDTAKTFVAYTSAPFDVKNEKKSEKPMSFHSKNLVEPSFHSGMFSFPSNEEEYHIMPSIGVGKNRAADLVCFLEEPEVDPREYKWFVCSDQFYLFWRMINFDSHPSYKKGEKRGTVFTLKDHFTSGNRLIVDNWKKYVLACQENNIPVDLEESNKRFYAKRTEKMSLENIDLYTSIVMIVIYGEYPNFTNVPTTGLNSPNQKDPQRTKWQFNVNDIITGLVFSGKIFTLEELELAAFLPFSGKLMVEDKKLSAKDILLSSDWTTAEDEVAENKMMCEMLGGTSNNTEPEQMNKKLLQRIACTEEAKKRIMENYTQNEERQTPRQPQVQPNDMRHFPVLM